MEDRTVRCIYCHADIEDYTEEPVPSLDDDARWVELAEEHADDCEWIATRAHRRDPETGDQTAAEYSGTLPSR